MIIRETIMKPKKNSRKLTPLAKKGTSKTEGRFVQDLLIRQEAAKLSADGTLPLSATHVITDETAEGPTVKRVRFKQW